MNRGRVTWLLSAVVGAAGGVAGAQPCAPQWSPVPGAELDGGVEAMRVIDNGTGPALYVGGSFVSAGGLLVNRVARFDGAAWSGLGDGISHHSQGFCDRCAKVHSLAWFDDGTGGGVFVGGDYLFAVNAIETPLLSIARYRGVGYEALDGGTAHASWCVDCPPRVVAMEPYGGRLVLGGTFYSAGAVASTGVVAWTPAGWAPLGGEGVSMAAPGNPNTPQVAALAVYDDGRGGGPKLYAAGQFTHADGVPASCVAVWNGAAWAGLGSGLGPNGEDPPWCAAWALQVYDDGTGPALYVGGEFQTAGGVPALNIAKWNGLAWSAVGAGTDAQVRSLGVYDDGTGPALYVGGDFTRAGGRAASRIARWNGRDWRPLADGLDSSPYAMTAFEDATGPALYVGGWFSTSEAMRVPYLARWGRQCCPADADGNGNVQVGDIFTFLSAWFTGDDPLGDADGNGAVEVADIFQFLSWWFAGCA